MNFKMAALAAVAITFMASVADAQTRVNPNRSADVLNQQVLDVLQARTVTAPPAPPVATAPVAPTRDALGVYVGAGVGSTFQDGATVLTGITVGYQITPNFGAELTYDYDHRDNSNNGSVLMLNGVAQMPVMGVTPYVLAGVGAGFDRYNVAGRADGDDYTTMYNVGLGVRYNLNTNWQLDARYRYVAPFNTGEGQTDVNMLTLGVNYRF